MSEHTNRMFRNAVRLVATVMVAAAITACASDVELIDRTQPNRVAKSIFDPNDEWYFRPTVIEVDANQGFLVEGLEGEMERVRWRIEKSQLIAYRSYEWLEGAEEGSQGTTHFEGSPVAVFAIVEHFDVLREYNAATGEQSNVLVENTTDRPWYERDFMRVDWSQNLLDDSSWSLEGFLSAIAAAPYYVQEHEVDNPHRPEIAEDVINVVGSYLLRNDFYTCYVTFLDPYFCGTSEARVKMSFMKVKERNYEPLYYPDVLVLRDEDGNPLYRGCYTDGTCEKATVEVFERFGYFRHERRAYDDEYQWLRDGRIFLGHRWNIWRAMRTDAGLPIPADQRDPGEIRYFLNADFPSVNDGDGDGLDDDLWMATAATEADVAAGRAERAGLVTEWDAAFRETVASLKRQDPEFATVTADLVPTIYSIQPNSCNLKAVRELAARSEYESALREFGIATVERGNLKRACAILEWASAESAEPFTWQKPGDLRYSFVNWVDTPQAAGPLGYGPASADPVTGEIISANANIYGAAIDRLSAYAADVVALMNDDLAVSELITGENVRAHIATTRARTNRTLSYAKLQDWQARQAERGADFIPSQMRLRLDDTRRGLEFDRDAIAHVNEMLQPTAARGRAKLEALAGTPLERELLLSDDLRRAMLGPDGFQPGQPADPSFSALDWMTTELAEDRAEVLAELGRRTILLEEWADDGMISLAVDLQGKTWEEVYDWMRREIYDGVAAHEVGHNLGLRHNFRGSIDPLNFGPEFWSHYEYDAGSETGSVNKAAGADKHMYSSIMDYDARFYADTLQGLGLYDKAAIKFGYGNLVEVFATDMVYNYTNFLALYDYTDYPRIFGDNLQCLQNGGCDHPDALDALGSGGYCGLEDDYERSALQAEADGDWAEAAEFWNQHDIALENCDRYVNSYWLTGLEGADPRPQNINLRSDIPFDYLVDQWTRYYSGRPYQNIPDEVPYKFCPDEFARWTWVECKPWDKGANFLEITRDRMERYDSYYFFTNFNRDNALFNDHRYVASYMSRLYSRYFRQMSNAFIYGLYGGSFVGYDKNGKRVTLADFSLGGDWEAAGIEGMNFLTSILEQPEPGSHCYDATDARNQLTRAPTGYNGDDSTQIFSGMRLRGAPIEPGSVVVHVPVVGDLTDADSDGVLEDSGAAASGNIDYATGALDLDLGLPAGAGRIEADYVIEVFRPGCDTGTVIEVPLGVGKYYLTNWTDEYYYKATRVGTFYDKYLALFALTDNEGFFYRDFSSYFDVGAFSLSYWSGGLQEEMLELFTSAFLGEPGTYAWRYDGSDERILPAPVVDIYDREEDHEMLLSLPRIESASSWTLRWYGVVLPMLRFNDMFDYAADFSNYARVCLDGYYDCLDFDAALGTTTYTDPLTNYTYVASNTDRPELAIGANMLREAQALADNVYQPARDAWEALACVDDDPRTECADAHDALLQAERQITEYTSFLDIVREVSYIVDR